MCRGCWEESLDVHEGAAPVTTQVIDAADAIRALYEVHGHDNGGALHVAVDDWNLDDESVLWCGQDNGPLDDTERACWESLMALSEHERATALAIHEGFYVPPDATV